MPRIPRVGASCRHAGAVILLGGWLLMLPPTVNDPQDRANKGLGWRAVTDAPITKWDQLQAYDTAAECEATKAGEEKFHSDLWFRSSERRIRQEEKQQTKGTNPAAEAHAAGRTLEDDFARDAVGYAHARCVPADAVYPPPQAAPAR